ncbi:MAG: SMC-Scp complex subunit ScpB [Pirellulales bacterium]
MPRDTFDAYSARMGDKRDDEPVAEKSDFGLPALAAQHTSAGLALDQLSAALAGMLASGDDPYSSAPQDSESGELGEDPHDRAADADDACEITPRSILEAMLFVGSPQNEPLASKQVAALMRGVRPAEIDALVRDLNEAYERRNCPYTIVQEGGGYRLALRAEFARLRDKFYGKVRLARLSQAAIEVLAAVAYNEPTTSEEVTRLRGTASGHVLAHLVRRQLLRLERSAGGPRRVVYSTTPRFLELFGLESLADLPRSGELEQA